MSADLGALAGRAAALRRAFDRSFAEAPSAGPTLMEDLLAIRVAGDPYAVRLAEISGLFADKRVTQLPGPLPELLGIAGFRGMIAPVYDLRALLGHPGGGAPRWLVLAAAMPVALAFDALDGHLRVPREAIVANADPGVRSEVVSCEVVRPIVDIPSLLETLARRAREAAGPVHPSKKEQ